MFFKKLNIQNDYEKVEIAFYGRRNYKDSLALLYHENSKLTHFLGRLLGVSVTRFGSEFFHTRASQPFKAYPGYKVIPMDEFKNIPFPEKNIFQTIESRRSIRHYDKEYKMTLKDIFYLCHYSYGISFKLPIRELKSGHWCYRNVPSGGALHPLELYVVVLNGEVENGLYHYRPDLNAVEFLKGGEFYEAMKAIITAEPIVELKAACGIVFTTSIFERTLIKYGDRGYRFILQEVGYVGQNLSLICEAIDLASCMIGGYNDDKINDFIGIDGLSETVQNVLILGKKRPAEATAKKMDNN